MPLHISCVIISQNCSMFLPPLGSENTWLNVTGLKLRKEKQPPAKSLGCSSFTFIYCCSNYRCVTVAQTVINVSVVHKNCQCCAKIVRYDMTIFWSIIVIAITFYSPSCLGQETTKGPFGLRVKLPPAYLSTTHGRGFTLSLLMLNVKQESCEYQFL